MAQKQIRRGDIVRIRHNNSGHGFKENTLGIVKKCFPLRSEYPNRFVVATADEWWYVEIEDITLFKRDKNAEDDYDF